MSDRNTAAAECFPIRTVAAMTGVTAVTLRAWERRYGLVQPRRTESGHRVYTRDDVRLIRRVVKLLDRGIPIGRVAPLLGHEADDPFPSDDELDVRDASVWRDAREKMLQAVAEFDEQRMNRIYNESLSYYTMDLVTKQLVLPTLSALGERWQSRPEGIAEEHFFSEFLRNKLGARFHHLSSYSSGPKLVLSCMPEEQHEIGLMMFALYAATNGYRVIMLGASMPSEGLAPAARHSGSHALVLSASRDPAPAIFAAVQKLASELPIPVFIGGSLSAQFRSGISDINIQFLGSEFDAALRKLNERLDFQSAAPVQ